MASRNHREQEVLDALGKWGNALEWEGVDPVELSRIVTRIDERRPQLTDAEIASIAERVVEELQRHYGGEQLRAEKAERERWRSFVENVVAGVAGSAVYSLLLYLIHTVHLAPPEGGEQKQPIEAAIRAQLEADLSRDELRVLRAARDELIDTQFIGATLLSAFQRADPERFEDLSPGLPSPREGSPEFVAWVAYRETGELLLDKGAKKFQFPRFG